MTWRLFCGSLWRDGCWVRIKGYGAVVMRDSGSRPFSERYGHVKVWRAFGWKFQWLKP